MNEENSGNETSWLIGVKPAGGITAPMRSRAFPPMVPDGAIRVRESWGLDAVV